MLVLPMVARLFGILKSVKSLSFPGQVFFGDYTNVSAHNNVIRPIWARLQMDILSVWTAIVRPEGGFNRY